MVNYGRNLFYYWSMAGWQDINILIMLAADQPINWGLGLMQKQLIIGILKPVL
jgi:hypothetical protein